MLEISKCQIKQENQTDLPKVSMIEQHLFVLTFCHSWH